MANYNEGKRRQSQKGVKRKQFKLIVFDRGNNGFGNLLGAYHISVSEYEKKVSFWNNLYLDQKGTAFVEKLLKGRTFDYVNLYGPDRVYLRRVYHWQHYLNRKR